MKLKTPAMPATIMIAAIMGPMMPPPFDGGAAGAASASGCGLGSAIFFRIPAARKSSGSRIMSV